MRPHRSLPLLAALAALPALAPAAAAHPEAAPAVEASGDAPRLVLDLEAGAAALESELAMRLGVTARVRYGAWVIGAAAGASGSWAASGLEVGALIGAGAELSPGARLEGAFEAGYRAASVSSQRDEPEPESFGDTSRSDGSGPFVGLRVGIDWQLGEGSFVGTLGVGAYARLALFDTGGAGDCPFEACEEEVTPSSPEGHEAGLVVRLGFDVGL